MYAYCNNVAEDSNYTRSMSMSWSLVYVVEIAPVFTSSSLHLARVKCLLTNELVFVDYSLIIWYVTDSTFLIHIAVYFNDIIITPALFPVALCPVASLRRMQFNMTSPMSGPWISYGETMSVICNEGYQPESYDVIKTTPTPAHKQINVVCIESGNWSSNVSCQRQL